MYIMAGYRRTTYVGVTSDLVRRICEHQQGLKPGFTTRYAIKRLVYYESGQDVRAAIAREKQIKAWRRSKKVALIESANPDWQDLAIPWSATLPTQIPRRPAASSE